jgi:hypothetical protein
MENLTNEGQGIVVESPVQDTGASTTVEVDSANAEQKIEQSKDENSYFAAARRRAEKEFQEKLEKEKTRIEAEAKKKARAEIEIDLKDALPEGYNSLDEYLNRKPWSAGNVEPKFDTDLVKKVVEEAVSPLLTDYQTRKEHAETEKKNRYLVDEYTKAQKLFPDIKKPDDIPKDVWLEWNEGATGRSLISHLKEYRYDNDIRITKEKTLKEKIAQEKGLEHVTQVQGTNKTEDTEHIQLDEATINSLKAVGIPKDKWQFYAKKYYKK